MTPTFSLAAIKAGLSALKSKTQIKENELLNRLNSNEKISSSEETWLDQEANHVDEEALVNTLETASDFERALTRLNTREKKMVEELVKEGGDGKGASSSESGEAVADRRKRPTKCKAPEKKSESTPSTPSIFTRKENASLEQCIEILDWHHTNGKNQSKTAKHFAPIYLNLCIKQSLISAWLKDETKWRQHWAESEASHNADHAKRAKRARQVEHPEVDEMLEL
ncbi:unnamed protein product [Peniophora sp. CBMAI 1063]|nr:unnamed protein product [Peniophora sp. CBMAI 1063]